MKIFPFRQAFTLIELLVVISIIAILAGIALPVFSQVQERGQQTKALSNAKQIGLACKLYATDNEGQYPNKDEEGNVVTSNVSNDFLKTLIPSYISQEKIFFVAKSGWNMRGGIVQAPDEQIDTSANKLAPGENHWAYVKNLTETSNPSFPLLADGFSSTIGLYSENETEPGGVWKAKKAIIIRADQSGNIEKVQTTGQNKGRVLGQTGKGSNQDIFASADGWLSPTQLPLNPAPGT